MHVFSSIQSPVQSKAQSKNVRPLAEDKLCFLVENCPDMVLTLDGEGFITYASPSFRMRMGWTPSTLIGDHFLSYVHPEDADRIPRRLEQLDQYSIDSTDTSYWEVRFRPSTTHFQGNDSRLDNLETDNQEEVNWRWVSGAASNLLDDPNVQGILIHLRDVDARSRAESRLRLLDRAIDASNNGITVADARQKDVPLVYTNSGFRSITGYEQAEIAGSNCRFLNMPDRDQSAVERIREAVKRGEKAHEVLRNYRKDGTPFWNELYLSPIYSDDGTLTHYIGIQNDVTERVEVQQSLQERIHWQRQLERQVLETSGREQERIAHDLHDGLGQTLTGISILTKIHRQTLAERGIEDPDVLETVDNILEHLRTASEEVSRLAHGLHPIALSMSGLSGALQALLDSIHSDIAISFDVQGKISVESNEAALQLYRIAQEAVNNTVRHAQANQIHVNLIERDEQIELEVIDNGVGLDAEELSSRFGMGLHIMRYRAESLGGTVTIAGNELGGTTVACALPINAASRG